MSFNVGKFISTATQSVATRASSTSGSTKFDIAGSASKLASSLLGVGISAGNIDSLASLEVDNIVDTLSNDFFSKIGINIGSKSKNRLATGSSNTNPTALIGTDDTKSSLRYPADLGEYYISFEFMDYVRPAPLVTATVERKQFIYLPLPKELGTAFSVGYANVELGSVGTIADSVQLSAQNGSADPLVIGAGAAITKAVALKAITLADEIGKPLGMSKIGETSAAVVSQVTAAAVNPNIGVVFAGPQLRQMEFSWEFSPNNPAESMALKKIISEIQKRSLPAMTVRGSVALLSYPQMCQIQLRPAALDDIMPYKKAMVSSVQTSYSSSGSPAFFEGTKAPVFIGLKLSFMEIEYFLSEDFGGSDLYRTENGRSLSNDLVADAAAAHAYGATVIDEAKSLIKGVIG